jgi:hypothetical protein
MITYQHTFAKLKRRTLAHRHWLILISLTLFVTVITLTVLYAIGGNTKAPKLKKANGDVLYTASNSIYSSTIGTKQGEPKINFAVGESQASFLLAGAANSIPVKESSQSVVFPSVGLDTDLRYTITPNGIKEELTIHKYNNTTPNIYLFDLILQNITPKKLTTNLSIQPLEIVREHISFTSKNPLRSTPQA